MVTSLGVSWIWRFGDIFLTVTNWGHRVRKCGHFRQGEPVALWDMYDQVFLELGQHKGLKVRISQSQGLRFWPFCKICLLAVLQQHGSVTLNHKNIAIKTTTTELDTDCTAFIRVATIKTTSIWLQGPAVNQKTCTFLSEITMCHTVPLFTVCVAAPCGWHHHWSTRLRWHNGSPEPHVTIYWSLQFNLWDNQPQPARNGEGYSLNID